MIHSMPESYFLILGQFIQPLVVSLLHTSTLVSIFSSTHSVLFPPTLASDQFEGECSRTSKSDMTSTPNQKKGSHT
uniref:Uncharacterized protein n=2 Tax=Picea TaxID=3328 RepID=A0A117NIR5_PICGL|nr:hypothetical protein ABT39_MTgene233 [Picea glauca]QHR90109.1 hypothetical protein Q903MT_gene4132 [Picea sitchensis]